MAGDVEIRRQRNLTGGANRSVLLLQGPTPRRLRVTSPVTTDEVHAREGIRSSASTAWEQDRVFHPRMRRTRKRVGWRRRLRGVLVRGSAYRDCRVRLRCVTDPQESVVCRWLAAGDAGDLDAFDDLLHPDAVIHAPAGLSTTSAAEEKGVWRDALAAVTDLRHAVQEVVMEGDIEMARVVVTGTMTASFGGLQGTGRPFRIDQAVITHLRNGKIAEAWEIADITALGAQVSGESP